MIILYFFCFVEDGVPLYRKSDVFGVTQKGYGLSFRLLQYVFHGQGDGRKVDSFAPDEWVKM